MIDAVLQGRGLSRDHHRPRTSLFGPTPVRRVLDDADIDIFTGETVAIIGESGSGKSTLVRILLGLQRATAGTVTFDGRPVEPASAHKQRWLRRRTGIVLQDPYGSLNPRMTVAQIIAEPLRSLQIAADHRKLIGEVLERVGLPRDKANAYPHALSGGQRQRVAIARAIVHGPELLIGDEPMSALDVLVRENILELLHDLQQERGMGLVLVSHDLGLVRHVADKVCVMLDGRIVEQGRTPDLFLRPQHAHTRSLVAAIPTFPQSNTDTPLSPSSAPPVLDGRTESNHTQKE